MSLPLNEGAAPERTRGRQVESQSDFATDSRPNQARVSVAAHHGAQHALQAACLCVSLTAGKTPEQVAAEIAGRAVAALRGKESR